MSFLKIPWWQKPLWWALIAWNFVFILFNSGWQRLIGKRK